MSSILTAASAMRNHQTFMNVLANNIANMNTVGYKGSRILFQDMLSRTFNKGSGPTDTLGGINPRQIGLGMLIGSVSNNMSQGILQNTGRSQDLAITGSGFFIYSSPEGNVYSRDGALGLDADGALVNLSTGMRVQGWLADDNGTVDTAAPIEDLMIPVGAPMTAIATETITMAGNLNSSAAVGDTITSNAQFYDSLGNPHGMTVTLTKTANNTWSVGLSTTDTTITLPAAPTPATLTFTAQGQLQTPADGKLDFAVTPSNGAANQTVTLNFANVSQLNAVQGDRLYVTNQDGRAPGEMIDFNITQSGEVVAVYSNGLLKTLGQLAIAEFVNPGGLIKAGQNGYTVSVNSGEPQVGTAGERSQINAGFLEMSNVDLTLEFSEMIRAQRGFQANSRVVTTSDQMLEELVNLVR